MTLALEFPPISHLVEWPEFIAEGSPFAVSKIVLIYLLAVILTLALFLIGGRKGAMVPTGLQNIAESGVDFINNGIIMQTIGPEGLRKRWILPLLTSMFFFIFFCNITGIIPLIQMPANARMAVPLLLALTVWVIFNAVGVANQGPIGYLKSSSVSRANVTRMRWPASRLAKSRTASEKGRTMKVETSSIGVTSTYRAAGTPGGNRADLK